MTGILALSSLEKTGSIKYLEPRDSHVLGFLTFSELKEVISTQNHRIIKKFSDKSIFKSPLTTTIECLWTYVFKHSEIV